MSEKNNEKINAYIADLVAATIAVFDRIEKTGKLEHHSVFDKEADKIFEKHFINNDKK